MRPFFERAARLITGWHATFASLLERSSKGANHRTIAIMLVAGLAASLTYLYAVRPPDSFPLDQLVSVPQGESVSQVADLLQSNGVIRSPLVFRIVVQIFGRQDLLQAGDYEFTEPEDVIGVARAIAYGQFGLEPVRITIPEGLTVEQMSSVYAAALPRFDAADFVAQAQPLEGYLFPDTYFFLPNATASTVIQTMQQNFDAKILPLEPQIEAFGKPLDQVITMASIIEKEARDMKDRQMIAGVLWLRLSKGMPLQTDSTLLYVLPGENDGDITVADLASTSTYNTYTHTGLPPTPIDSPSLDSIEAAITPIDDGYLYYLADSKGVTHYCKTYSCQLANEKEYLGE